MQSDGPAELVKAREIQRARHAALDQASHSFVVRADSTLQRVPEIACVIAASLGRLLPPRSKEHGTRTGVIAERGAVSRLRDGVPSTSSLTHTVSLRSHLVCTLELPATGKLCKV
jgi:hypothetical protein